MWAANKLATYSLIYSLPGNHEVNEIICFNGFIGLMAKLYLKTLNLIPAFIRRRLAHRENLIKILDNIGWLFLDKILRMGVGVFVIVWIARYLGPEQYGQLSFAIAFVGLFGAISDLGLRNIVVREIVRNPGGRFEILGTTCFLQFIGGLLAYGLILIIIFWLRPEDLLTKTLVAILGSVMLLKPSEMVVYWYESQVQSKYTIWVRNSVFLVFAAIKIGFILNSAPLITFAWISMFEALFAALMLIAFLGLGLHGMELRLLRVSLARAMDLLKDSWPLIISSMSILIYLKIDQIMLGQMVGDAAVGVYGAAVQISEVWYFVAVAINASIQPSLVRLRERSSELFKKRLQQIFNLMVQLSLIVAIVVTVLSPVIIQLLFGDDFSESSSVLRIHVWAGIFVFLNNAVWAWYIIENKQKLANYRIVIGLFLNIVLNMVLIPLYGAIGAAWATLISRAFASYFGQMLFSETRFLFKMMSISILTIGLKKGIFK